MHACIVCGSERIKFLDEFSFFKGVTSDCKLWPRSGKFIFCKSCGHCQKDVSREWLNDVDEIYSDYEMFPLGNGNESLIFSECGNPITRFGLLLDNLMSELNLQEYGRVLDVGCGNGTLLQHFYTRKPGWELYGHEQAMCRANFSDFPEIKQVFSCDFEQIDVDFDLVLMTHVIEHLVNPVDMLKKIKKLLAPRGLILVQTVFFGKNPFDLITTDHCSHFSPDLLAFTLEKSGFLPIVSTEGWVNKEIGYIAKVGMGERHCIDVDEKFIEFREKLSWLKYFVNVCSRINSNNKLGVFGTANAGSWLAGVLGRKVSFFVDEDVKRWGSWHLGVPIIAPKDIPDGSTIIMGFTTEIAHQIVKRLSSILPKVKFIVNDNPLL